MQIQPKAESSADKNEGILGRMLKKKKTLKELLAKPSEDENKLLDLYYKQEVDGDTFECYIRHSNGR